MALAVQPAHIKISNENETAVKETMYLIGGFDGRSRNDVWKSVDAGACCPIAFFVCFCLPTFSSSLY
jgi:hypothetical protein